MKYESAMSALKQKYLSGLKGEIRTTLQYIGSKLEWLVERGMSVLLFTFNCRLNYFF